MPAQLGLFAGKRQRGRKPPPISEMALHCTVKDALDRWLMPGWFFFHPANGEQRETPTAIKLKRMGVKPGVADFVLFGPPHGSIHSLEIKRQGSQPTRAQIEFLHIVRAAGGKAEWADTFEKALGILQRWNALPTTIQSFADGQVLVRRAVPLEAEGAPDD